MGYCTGFTGYFKLDRQLASHHLAYLRAFNEVAHFHWDIDLIKNDPDPLREAVELPLGENGCYYTGPGYNDEYSYPILGETCPGMPNDHCDWRPNDDGTELVAYIDKFYGYIEWLQYLLNHFLVPWGYILNGEMTWRGEWERDTGVILVKANVITVRKAHLLNEELA